MNLVIIRHTNAVDPSATILDTDRAVTRAGKRRMVQALGAWKRLGIHIDKVAASPSLRTRQTAKLMRRKGIYTTKLAHWECLKSGSEVAPVIEKLMSHSDVATFGLVTHNPLAEWLCAYFLGPISFQMQPGTLVVIHTSPKLAQAQGRLRLLINLFDD